MSGQRAKLERLVFASLGASLAAWLALTACQAALRLTQGLRGEYFDVVEPAGQYPQPILTAVDDEISTERVTENWLGSPPPTFFVRWTGYLTVDRTAVYAFALTSDDGSTLSVDGRLLVDNGGRHGETTRSGQLQLDRGAHLIVLEYVQYGGPYSIRLTWARDGDRAGPVPPRLLTVNRVPYWKTAVARVIDWLRLAAAVVAATLLLGLALSFWRRPIVERVRLWPSLATLALFVALAALETWPLATNPARLSRNDNGDTVLNEWVMAWVVHQAPRAPLHLYDANTSTPSATRSPMRRR